MVENSICFTMVFQMPGLVVLRMFYGTLGEYGPRFADPGHHALNGAYFVVYFVPVWQF